MEVESSRLEQELAEGWAAGNGHGSEWDRCVRSAELYLSSHRVRSEDRCFGLVGCAFSAAVRIAPTRSCAAVQPYGIIWPPPAAVAKESSCAASNQIVRCFLALLRRQVDGHTVSSLCYSSSPAAVILALC